MCIVNNYVFNKKITDCHKLLYVRNCCLFPKNWMLLLYLTSSASISSLNCNQYIEESPFQLDVEYFIAKLQLSEKVFDKIPLKPWIQQLQTMDYTWVIRTAHFEHKVLRWAMRLNKPRLYDYIFFFFLGGGHFSFMSLWEHMTPGVVVANLNPRGMVGRVFIVNRYALINTNHRNCRLHGLGIFKKSHSPL